MHLGFNVFPLQSDDGDFFLEEQAFLLEKFLFNCPVHKNK